MLSYRARFSSRNYRTVKAQILSLHRLFVIIYCKQSEAHEKPHHQNFTDQHRLDFDRIGRTWRGAAIIAHHPVYPFGRRLFRQIIPALS